MFGKNSKSLTPTSGDGIAVAQTDDALPIDTVSVVIPGISAIELPEAREAFEVGIKAFGDRMMTEAERLEAVHRNDTSPKAQFTTKMIVLAEAGARDIEYRESPRRKLPKWVLPVEVGQYFFTALFGVAGGAAVGDREWLWLEPSNWGVVCFFSLLLGIIFTVTVRQGRKDSQ
ncbi:hypothetical protein [Clavibacter californiensis]|uniref:hypothetical protein n=1 Tax=Clavibacter californiensis TaxID=1401995 RepID=UPI0011C240A8|nr:hypothetical protein [Clavibacter californiensis]UKF78911.1 hypothetical protein FGD68_08810 [Clavibacter californiensis]